MYHPLFFVLPRNQGCALPVPRPVFNIGTRSGLWLLCLCWALMASGCAQRINAQVSAALEEGHSPAAQTFKIELLPTSAAETEQANEDKAQTLATLQERLGPALLDLGYTLPALGEDADISIRLYWFSTGPHAVYRSPSYYGPSRWHRRGFGRGYRWQQMMLEEQYLRYFVIEALLKNPAVPKEDYGLLSPMQAMRHLPAPPARILWRVVVESRGNLTRAEKILPEMVTAALPWLAKSAQVRLTIQGDSIVRQEAHF